MAGAFDVVVRMRQLMDNIRALVSMTAGATVALGWDLDPETAVRAITLSSMWREYAASDEDTTGEEPWPIGFGRGLEDHGFYDELLALWRETQQRWSA